MKLALPFVMILIGLGHFALAEASTSTPRIRSLVDGFYQIKESRSVFQSSQPLSHRFCEDPAGPSCSDVACKKLGTWGCDSLDEVKAVGVACRGNYDGTCLKSTCEKLGTWGCDSIDEVADVARACVGNYDMSCFESVCQRLGSWGCDSISEVTEVLKTCAGN